MRHATLDMGENDSPTPPPVSLWEKNLRAIRAERWWDVTVLISSAIKAGSSTKDSAG